MALIDAWPPPVLVLMTTPSAASTVRWSVHLIDPSRFDPDGGVIAFSEQLVAYF